MRYHVVLATAALALLGLGRTSAVAQNLLSNPGFDGDLSGWTLVEPAEFDPDLDATGTPGSGSARLASGVTGTDTIVLSQCLPAVAGASYTFGVEVFHGTLTPAGVELIFFSTIDCTANVLDLEGPLHAAFTPGAWAPVDSAPVVAPSGTLSMLVAGVRSHINPDELATTNWDDFYVLEEGGEPVPGTITVVKATGGDDGTFAFSSSLPGNASFSITTSGGSGQHGPITVTEPGPYSIAETVPDGWTLTSATCDNGDDPAQVTVGRQESVTCTFVNQAVEVVPALPWVGAITLMLLLATSAAWALRRARGARALWIATVGLLLASLPGVALAANPATEPAGAESPRALVARMNAAQAEGDFGTIVNCIEPKGRTELTAGLLTGTVMMVAFSGAFGEMAGTMAEELGEAMTGEEPSAEQQQEIEASQQAAAQRVEKLNRRLAAILQEHGLPDLTDENAPLPEGGPEELLAKIDQGALVNDLMELMAGLEGDQGGNPAGELPVPKEVTGYRIDGDRAEARAGDEPVHFVRIDGRWFLEVPEVDDDAE